MVVHPDCSRHFHRQIFSRISVSKVRMATKNSIKIHNNQKLKKIYISNRVFVFFFIKFHSFFLVKFFRSFNLVECFHFIFSEISRGL